MVKWHTENKKKLNTLFASLINKPGEGLYKLCPFHNPYSY